MKKAEEINDTDFYNMMKDLETLYRHDDQIKKIKKKFQSQDKKYKKNVEHMKEFKEEEYQKRNKELIDRYEKKEERTNAILNGNQKSKLAEKQKTIQALIEKENLARQNIKKFMEKQEIDRQKFEKDSNEKSKKKIIIIKNIYFNF